jgi:hypothetical protein
MDVSCEQVRVDPRFNGPPGVGNGGYVSGLLAERVGASAEVTLRRATPLARSVVLRCQGEGEAARWTLEDEEGVLVEARVASPEVEVPHPPSFSQAQAVRSAPVDHPFPDCFVCGPRRISGAGLDILPGPCGEGRVAAPWIPTADLADDSGFVAQRFLWAALDCPGALAAMLADPRPMVLGRITGTTLGRVRPGESCVVIGWHIGRDGRKHTAGTALFGSDGRALGVTRQVWFQVDPTLESGRRAA